MAKEKDLLLPNAVRGVDGKRIETVKRNFGILNSIEVEVGTNGHQGGDAGHGCRTVFRLRDLDGTYMACSVLDDGNGVEIILGGDSELDTFYSALETAVKVLGRHTNGYEEPSVREMREFAFTNYVNELCQHFRETGKLRGMGAIRTKYRITGLTKQQFYEAELHKAKGYIPAAYCGELYDYLVRDKKTANIPVLKQENT